VPGGERDQPPRHGRQPRLSGLSRDFDHLCNKAREEANEKAIEACATFAIDRGQKENLQALEATPAVAKIIVEEKTDGCDRC
ncbi:unnamed protein product, partial [Ectocarpus sp. 6 AP-2014]